MTLDSVKDIPSTRKMVFDRPRKFVEEGTSWCPGCGYGAIARIILEELERADPAKLVTVSESGCLGSTGVLVPGGDHLSAMHGRTVSALRAVKWAIPDAFAIGFQGDGGMLNEGLNEVIHAAASGENICVVLGNNGVLGDTGGQYTMGAAEGLKTSTSPSGRNSREHGARIPICEILAMFPGTAFVARVSSHDPAFVYRGQRLIRKAFEANMAGAGFTFIECMTTCPTGWRMSAVDAAVYQGEHILDKTPVGIIKDWNPGTFEPFETPLRRLGE